MNTVKTTCNINWQNIEDFARCVFGTSNVLHDQNRFTVKNSTGWYVGLGFDYFNTDVMMSAISMQYADVQFDSVTDACKYFASAVLVPMLYQRVDNRNTDIDLTVDDWDDIHQYGQKMINAVHMALNKNADTLNEDEKTFIASLFSAYYKAFVYGNDRMSRRDDREKNVSDTLSDALVSEIIPEFVGRVNNSVM